MSLTRRTILGLLGAASATVAWARSKAFAKPSTVYGWFPGSAAYDNPPCGVYVGFQDMKPSAKTVAMAVEFVAPRGYIYISDSHSEYATVVINKSCNIRGGDFHAPVTVVDGADVTIENAYFNGLQPPAEALRVIRFDECPVEVREPTPGECVADGDWPPLRETSQIIEFLKRFKLSS